MGLFVAVVAARLQMRLDTPTIVAKESPAVVFIKGDTFATIEGLSSGDWAFAATTAVHKATMARIGNRLRTGYHHAPLVGRTPRSAADPLVGLLFGEKSAILTEPFWYGSLPAPASARL